MSLKFYSGSKTAAYASLNIGEKDFNALGEYCLQQHFEVDTFAEETDHFVCERPLLNHLLQLIEQKKIISLVIPSMDHVLGTRFNNPSEFLNYLKRHGVWLHSLADEGKNSMIH